MPRCGVVTWHPHYESLLLEVLEVAGMSFFVTNSQYLSSRGWERWPPSNLPLISSFFYLRMWISSAFLYFVAIISFWKVKIKAMYSVSIILVSVGLWSRVMFLVDAIEFCVNHFRSHCVHQLFLYGSRICLLLYFIF